MRGPRPWILILSFAACGGDPAIVAVPTAAPTESAPQQAAPVSPVSADPGLSTVAARMLAGTATAADHDRAVARANDAVAELLAAAAAATDVTSRARAPAAILALGTPALPALARGLAHQDVVQRRIAALTLLQWSESLHAQRATAPILAALAAAREDPDPAVRAAAEHAWRRASGDTTAIDRSRSEHDRAERNSR